MSALATKARASSTEGLCREAERVVTALPAAKSSTSSSQLSPRHEPDPAGQVQTAARRQQVLPWHPRHGASVHHSALRRESEISDQGTCLSIAIIGQGWRQERGRVHAPEAPDLWRVLGLSPLLMVRGKVSGALRPSPESLALTVEGPRGRTYLCC